MSEPANHGWGSDFPEFRSTPPARIRENLSRFVADASLEQIRAWNDCIPPLQREISEILGRSEIASRYSAILEYQLPMESRRSDVIFLIGAGVMVVELKGKAYPSQADLDQVAAYARDLRNYHRECADRPVVPVLVPTRARGYQQEIAGIHVTGPDALDGLVERIAASLTGAVIGREAFLSEDAYRPLPSLVAAARELFRTGGNLRRIHRAASATEPAVEEISRIIHTAAHTKSRHLILLSGAPGAGKTLVGLRTVHAHYLDDLAVERAGSKEVPAVFLSGNQPLVEVLQYELRDAGGDGKTFVRHVKKYVEKYSKSKSIPPEHVLVFDEAQRAFDAAKMQKAHKDDASRSEPALFIEFADRIPDWCVVLGLIGSGQEIHEGEEAGLSQWREAVEGARNSAEWTIHAPPHLLPEIGDAAVQVDPRPTLHLDTELRFHAADDVHRLVAGMLEGADQSMIVETAQRLQDAEYHLRITRDLDKAKSYLRERYADEPDKRFGMIASSRDKDLVKCGVPNDFQARKFVRVGPWYGDDESDESGRSCRLLSASITEFEAQGLELDAVLLAWGTDLMRIDGIWSNSRAAKYLKSVPVRDPLKLRINAYRVLLTRGRDGTVVFVPPLPELDETFTFLRMAGFLEL